MIDDLSNIKPAQILTDEALDALELKPPQVSDPEYYRAIAHLKAGGADNAQISTLLGVAIEEVNKAVGLRHIKDLTFEIQKRANNRDYANLFKDMLPDAVEVTRDLMLSTATKEGTRLSAAVAIMDRALGKPQQNVDVGSSLIRDLFAALDRHEKGIVTEAIQIEAKAVNNDVSDAEYTEREKPAMEVNKIDIWAKEHLK